LIRWWYALVEALLETIGGAFFVLMCLSELPKPQTLTARAFLMFVGLGAASFAWHGFTRARAWFLIERG
jgi:hypothetical protein